MRARWLVLIFVLLSTATGSLVWILTHRASRRQPVTIVERAIPDSMAVWIGRAGDLEIMLRPYHAEADRDEFHRRRWNAELGMEAAPHSFRLLWLVHHGATPMANPFAHGARLELDAQPAQPIDEVLRAAPRRPGAQFQLLAQAGSLAAHDTLLPGEVVKLVYATAGDLDLDAHAAARIAGGGLDLGLRPARAALIDVWRFEEAPRGTLAEIAHVRQEKAPARAVSELKRNDK
jgi:hypothetical protein